MNAAVVADAEVYYRNMLTRDELTWNLRDQHSAHREAYQQRLAHTCDSRCSNSLRCRVSRDCGADLHDIAKTPVNQNVQ